MNKIMLFLLLLAGLWGCQKPFTIDDTNTTNNPIVISIFDTVINPDYLVDTVTISDNAGVINGYFFAYDNLNRVTSVKYYDYFFNQPVNIERSCTFSYTGNNILPTSLDVFWNYAINPGVENYKVYFFYNADKSKNRDSLIDLNNPSQRAVRKYIYNTDISIVKTKYYKNADTIPAFEDSARFNNFNCTMQLSDRIGILSGQQYSLERNANLFDNNTDTKVNPFSKINIYPAMFMSNYINPGYLTDDFLSRSNLAIDFNFRNNLKRFLLIHFLSGGATQQLSRTSRLENYDTKNRITQKSYTDSVNNGGGMNFISNFILKYKYRY